MQTVSSISGRAGGDVHLCQAAPHEVQVQERFEILTEDGTRLSATLHAPAGEPKAAVQIHPGVGVKRQFYQHFASYLASRGYAVLGFDVRGMGESLHEPLRRCQATMLDWGRKDMPAALDWLAGRYPNIPRFAVAHSLGGQLTGLMPNHQLLNGLVLVFSCKGDFAECSPKGKAQAILFLRMYLPLMLPLFGYAPVRFLMTAQDMPAGVARDWIRLIFHRRWIKGDAADRGEETYYDKFSAPILALALENDPLAPARACANLLRDYYNGTQSELITLRAADAAQAAQLTHLGYFRRKFAESHWSRVAAWLDGQVDQLAQQADRLQAMTA